MKLRIAAGLALTAVLVVTVGFAFFLGTRHNQNVVSIKRVTATDVANAMKEDHFYADYNQSTLVVAGTVSSLSTHGNNVIAGLKTDSSFRTLCDLGSRARITRIGTRITVVAEGSSAQRQSSAVLLAGCTIL